MRYFAQVNSGVVSEVVVSEQAPGMSWIETFTDGTRGHYAGVGYVYMASIDAFVPPSPFPSWSLDSQSLEWVAPLPRPSGNYRWDENLLSWVEL
jgi:hypothetical protein